MLLIVKKGIRGGICHGIHRYAKANNKYMKNYNKNLNHHISSVQIQTICMDGVCLKNACKRF